MGGVGGGGCVTTIIILWTDMEIIWSESPKNELMMRLEKQSTGT